MFYVVTLIYNWLMENIRSLGQAVLQYTKNWITEFVTDALHLTDQMIHSCKSEEQNNHHINRHNPQEESEVISGDNKSVRRQSSGLDQWELNAAIWDKVNGIFTIALSEF